MASGKFYKKSDFRGEYRVEIELTSQMPLPGLPAPDTADVRAGAPDQAFSFFMSSALGQMIDPAYVALRDALDEYIVVKDLDVFDVSPTLSDRLYYCESLLCRDISSRLFDLGGMAGEW